MAKLSELFNVNHFIVSQVNPHIVPFLEKGTNVGSKTAHGFGKAETQEASIKSNGGLKGKVLDLAVGEIMHRIHMLSELGIFPVVCTKVQSMLSQRYSGDITIVPDISYTDYPALMSNPSPDFLIEARLRGERATWPKLSIIHNHCAVELAIDNALYAMNVKMVFGNSQALHHYRHRSHEPQMHQPSWDGALQKRWLTSLQPSNSNGTHPALSMEITPLDVDDPQQLQNHNSRFLPSRLASHRSTPSTPSEESQYRKGLSGNGTLVPGTALEMSFASFDSQTGNSSEDSVDSPMVSEHASSTAAFPSISAPDDDRPRRKSISVTPPSTPLNSTISLVSPTLACTGLRASDVSGTRRMMLKRKSSSFLRASTSPTNTRFGENGSRSST